MTFELDMAAGQVEILLEDRERAEIRLEPMVAGDEVAADLISRARHISRGSVLDLRIPHPEPTVLAGGNTVIHQSFGNVVQGAVVTGAVIVNGQIVSGNGVSRTTGGGVKVTARLPLRSRLKATTVSANVVANEHLPTVDFESTSGDLHISYADRLRAHTISGDITVDSAEAVDIETTSGDVQIGPVFHLQARTVSGDIDAGHFVGSHAQLKSVSGDVALHAKYNAEVTARTVSGDIRITARDGVRVTTHAKSVSGRVRTPNN
ncbi:DUF4097 family beta strand repeat-containing protein [Saccharopolyspora sp. NPDC002686]|uniref:DUF4097 family beta strand repeat-containing protein n=1 Tax=Saccharopolyspora sp. NPDC002686 TaxID=3154541 RepID=UPI00332BA019